jgi:NAD-dependent DNA ligase
VNYDSEARESFKKSPNTTISWYLAASYAYYTRYESLLSDETYDKMCKYMLDNYEKLEHTHKHLVDKEALRAGTGYQIKEYPLIVQVTAEGMIRKLALEKGHS